jgi:hypothetical protein
MTISTLKHIKSSKRVVNRYDEVTNSRNYTQDYNKNIDFLMRKKSLPKKKGVANSIFSDNDRIENIFSTREMGKNDKNSNFFQNFQRICSTQNEDLNNKERRGSLGLRNLDVNSEGVLNDLKYFMKKEKFNKRSVSFIFTLVSSLVNKIMSLESRYSKSMEEKSERIQELTKKIEKYRERSSKALQSYLEKESAMNDKMFEIMCQCQTYLREKQILQDRLDKIERKYQKKGKRVFNFMINNSNNANNSNPINESPEPLNTEKKVYEFSSSRNSSNMSLHSKDSGIQPNLTLDSKPKVREKMLNIREKFYKSKSHIKTKRNR